MVSKDICLQLLSAESEKEIDKLIQSSSEMKNPKNWRPLDGRETNFNVTGNQASDGGKALTELMTNMVDAVLLKHAYEKGIDPKDTKRAPPTMYKAVDVLIKNMRGGKLVNLSSNDPWLKDFAQKNLAIGITAQNQSLRDCRVTPSLTMAKVKIPMTSSGHSFRSARAIKNLSHLFRQVQHGFVRRSQLLRA